MAVRVWKGDPLAVAQQERGFWPPAPAVLPRVTVIVACYGQLAYTQGLVKSLRENAGCEYELILVSNGCPETARWAQVNDLQCLAFPENRGVPAAYNAGVKASSGQIIALFNNDMAVHPGGLRRLVEATYQKGMAAQTGNSWNTAGDYLGCTADLLWADAPEGYALAFQREVWAAAGEWDETFFPSYGDDCDWAFRARLKGYDFVLVPRCVEHFGQKTSGSMGLSATVRKHQEIIRERYLQAGLGHRLLVIRYAAAGDILMATPTIRALKRETPLGRLHVYADPGAGKVLAGNPYVDARRDGVIDLRQYSRTVDLTNAYELPQRFGEWRHPVRAYCERAGVEYDGAPYDLFLTPAQRTWAGEQLKGERGVLVAAGLRSGTRTKQNWTAERWIELADSMPAGARLLALDSALQPPLGPHGASEADQRFYAHPNVVDRTGRSADLHEAAALLERCEAFVGVDSGLLHVAHAFRKPVVVIGAAAPLASRLPLIGIGDGFEGAAPCFPCQYRDQCPQTHCLDWVQGQWVAEKLVKLVPRIAAPVLRPRAPSATGAHQPRTCFHRN